MSYPGLTRFPGLALAAALVTPMLAPNVVAAVSLLGPDGSTYQLAPRLVDGSPQLTLEVIRFDGSSWLEVVPGTEGADEERNPTLVLDDRSMTVFAVWEQRLHGVFSQLLLAQRAADGTWSSAIELSGNPFATRGDLQVAVDSGSPGMVAAGESAPTRRQLLSLLWAEEAGPGHRVMFSPVSLLDGVYPGANPVLPLSGFGVDLSPATLQLTASPALARAQEPETVTVAFLDPEDDTYRRVLVRALPLELSVFADKARAEIIELGAQSPGMGRPELASKARAEIIELGSRLHPSLKLFAAEAVQASLLAASETDIYELADKARAEIIELGARALDPSPGRSGTFVSVPVGVDLGGDFELIWLASLPRPPVPEDATIEVSLVSPSGSHAVLVWTATRARPPSSSTSTCG